MSLDKLCPFFRRTCYGERCALWFHYNNMCAVLRIAKELNAGIAVGVYQE